MSFGEFFFFTRNATNTALSDQIGSAANSYVPPLRIVCVLGKTEKFPKQWQVC